MTTTATAPRPAPPLTARALHVLNGDATRQKLEGSTVPGTLAVWADVLHEGPVPGEEVPAEEWRERRARYIAEVGYAPYAIAREVSRGWDAALERYAEHDEVVIWCEHDLFDQLLLIRHLHWFARRAGDVPALGLVCIGSHPTVPGFMGLGQLDAEQLAALAPARQPITPEQLALGAAAWRAFTSPDPAAIERFLAGDTMPLPFLRAALLRHLEEFPGTRDGLSRTERQILALLRDSPRAPAELFRAAHRLEDVFYAGDASFRTILNGLAAGAEAAIRLEVEAGPEAWLPPGTVEITDAGRAFLDGAADRVARQGIDRWLGGVHLRGHDVWRWDEADRRLVPPGRGG